MGKRKKRVGGLKRDSFEKQNGSTQHDQKACRGDRGPRLAPIPKGGFVAAVDSLPAEYAWPAEAAWVVVSFGEYQELTVDVACTFIFPSVELRLYAFPPPLRASKTL